MKQHKSIKLEQSLIDSINEQAVKENRSFNNMVEYILSNYFKPKVDFDFTVQTVGCNHKYKPNLRADLDNDYELKCINCGEKPEPIGSCQHNFGKSIISEDKTYTYCTCSKCGFKLYNHL